MNAAVRIYIEVFFFLKSMLKSERKKTKTKVSKFQILLLTNA